MSYDESVKVCDIELKNLAKLAECWEDINALLQNYVSILNKINKDAVKSGKVHDALEQLEFYASEYHNYAEGLGTKVASISNGFLNTIERIDLDLYNG